MKKLDQLNFENSFARLPETFHSRLKPTPLPDPYLVSFNADAARHVMNAARAEGKAAQP